ncbi:MAG: dihydropyrimidinase [Armatimonadetes bacterium]|nr:dihydropyrimidinase [Armatimonadota bacterium]
MMDLVVKNGTVVTSGSMAVSDVGVEGEKIAVIGPGLTGKREIDARGKYVFPGGIDVHVHLTPSYIPGADAPKRVDDFLSGSAAAVAGGITTIGNMTFQRPGETLREGVARDMEDARRNAVCDYVLHPVLTDPSERNLAQLPDLAADGHTSLKIFLLFEHFDARVADYIKAIQTAGRHGTISMLHCEDGALIRCVCQELLAKGLGAPRYYPNSRPVFTESASVERAVAIVRATGAPAYIVHLSSRAALDAARRGRADGLPVYVETRPIYLYLTRERFEEPDAAKYVGNPPLREVIDLQSIWHGLHHGDIQCLCSDHVGWSLEQKLEPGLNITTVRPGMADLETLMPMLYSEGVHGGRISLSRFVEVTSTNTAKLFGMYPQKGTIAVGSDADLVVWDPAALRKIEGSKMRSNAGYSVYEGRQVQGWPACTISRGEVVFENGEITARRGRGKWVRRGRTMAL